MFGANQRSEHQRSVTRSLALLNTVKLEGFSCCSRIPRLFRHLKIALQAPLVAIQLKTNRKIALACSTFLILIHSLGFTVQNLNEEVNCDFKFAELSFLFGSFTGSHLDQFVIVQCSPSFFCKFSLSLLSRSWIGSKCIHYDEVLHGFGYSEKV